MSAGRQEREGGAADGRRLQNVACKRMKPICPAPFSVFQDVNKIMGILLNLVTGGLFPALP